MDELGKGFSVGVAGPLREEALSKCLRQIDAWAVALPEVEPLVWDFGLGDFYQTGLIEFWIANEIQAGYCGKYLFLFDGQTCPRHHHRQKHETFFIVKGAVKIECDGETYDMNSGGVLAVAQDRGHSFTGQGAALILELSQPCLIDDNYFANRDIPIGGNYRESKGHE